MPEMTEGWMQHYLAAMLLLNLMQGVAPVEAPLPPPTQETVLRTLNEIARGEYRPHGLLAAETLRTAVSRRDRPPNARAEYTVIVLNARTTQTEFASVQTGGVLFDDPAWAVFAAEAIGRGRMFGVPRAADGRDLRERLRQLDVAVRGKTYRPEVFFAPILSFANPSVPTFSLITMTGAELTALRNHGLQSFGRPVPMFYVLYEPERAGN